MENALLGLMAETSLHAGTGRRTGVIDLPIMREAHTNWPCVFGSAVKGAMRSLAQRQQAAWLVDVFGPDTSQASDHAGALAVGDARLLLLPVRSLNSHFKWVTCPALLRRLAADARRLGIGQAPSFTEKLPGEDHAVAHEGGSQETQLFLEEFSFAVSRRNLGPLIDWLARFRNDPKEFKAQLQAQLVIVSDDMFAHLATYATPVTPHIAIDSKRKVVTDGALWYEETLPPETVLYLSLAAHPSRRGGAGDECSAAWVLQQALSLFPSHRPYLQLGGNETVGMGWCQVHTVQSSLQEV